ncbi:hypothetical protein CDEST_12240 [Colletotrichum destructivum]|uniref:Uncharacterized protein n=1 Tax=Colletotrichum destructivum TaxID=34406 RepID=A0AAX4IVI0_9PEZI|nr:hypothetical protein CDEST_12240 [Colletotrichum destructivum]
MPIRPPGLLSQYHLHYLYFVFVTDHGRARLLRDADHPSTLFAGAHYAMLMRQAGHRPNGDIRSVSRHPANG